MRKQAHSKCNMTSTHNPTQNRVWCIFDNYVYVCSKRITSTHKQCCAVQSTHCLVQKAGTGKMFAPAVPTDSPYACLCKCALFIVTTCIRPSLNPPWKVAQQCRHAAIPQHIFDMSEGLRQPLHPDSIHVRPPDPHSSAANISSSAVCAGPQTHIMPARRSAAVLTIKHASGQPLCPSPPTLA